MSTTRTFIAIPLSATVRRKAEQLVTRLSASGAKVKWVAPQQIHITLKFLGEVPNEQTIDVCRAVAAAAEGTPPFDIECQGAGAFPSPERPRIVWGGVGAGSETLVPLQAAIEEAMGGLGYPFEARRYVPHLTLGRVRGGGRELARLGELIRAEATTPLGESPVDEVLVMASYLERTGPSYEVLGRAPLG